MRIENTTVDTLREVLSKATESELKAWRFRFLGLFHKHFLGNDEVVTVCKVFGEDVEMTRAQFYDRYRVLIEEVEKRKIKSYKRTALDEEVMKRATLGIDPSTLAPLSVRDFVVIGGQFARSHKDAGDVEVFIKTTENGLSERVTEVIIDGVKTQTGREVRLVYNPPPNDQPYIPLYDLILKPLVVTKKTMAVSEPRREYICKYCDREAKWAYTYDEGREFIATCHAHRMKARNEFLADRSRECVVKHINEIIGGEIEVSKTEIEAYEKAEYTCECLDCEYVMTTNEHCRDIECPKCGGEMRRVERPGPGARDDETEKKFDVLKPYPNEHSARLRSPDDFASETFRRTKGGTVYGTKKIPSDVSVIWGKLRGASKPSDNPIPQAIRFPKDTWSVERAKKWLSDNNIKYQTFEPAGDTKRDEHEWALKVEKVDEEKRLVGGIVYEPNAIDTQGDYTDEEEIQKAMYAFMEKYAKDTKKIKLMHKGISYSFPIVEVFQPEQDTRKGKAVVKKGAWWLMVKVTNDEIWKLVKAGTLTGFSMGGTSSKF